MKTTIELPDDLLIDAKKRAAEGRTTLRALMERGLRLVLASPAEAEEAADDGDRPEIEWVVADGGLPKGLDLADRESLHAWLRGDR